jgi:hypothetical protein
MDRTSTRRDKTTGDDEDGEGEGEAQDGDGGTLKRAIGKETRHTREKSTAQHNTPLRQQQ